ncbi:MAG TPA: GAF domain-containing protein [Limnobacter sp.]|nr:GAF domain-containing protein [Limnobacter sp.]
MIKPELPHNEAERTRTLEDMGVIYSPSEARFDRITRLVTRHFGVSTCLISMLYKEIQWFKSLQGLNTCSTDREISFCGHAILQNDALVVENALLDPRFMDNPLVLDAPRIRFYAGHPVRDQFGMVLGTLCIIDGTPRAFSQEDRQDLQDFARLVEAEIAKPSEDSVVSRFVRALSENQRALLIDPMVGSWNSRGFEALLAKEMEFAASRGETLGLVKATLQSFDGIEARFGRDRLVDFSKFTAAVMRDTLPDSASLGSLGANCFVAVLPHTDRNATASLVDRLKKKFETLVLETHGVKALVDVDVQFVTFDKNNLPRSAQAALTVLQ